MDFRYENGYVCTQYKNFYQKYSSEKHHNISKEMIYFDITKYFVHKCFSDSAFSDLCRDWSAQAIKNGFYHLKMEEKAIFYL